MTKIFRPLCVSALCLLPSAFAAQVAFKSAAELVSVDVIATDESGRPVGGLSAKDFVLKVDGKVRPIQSVQLIQVANPDRPELPARPATVAAAPARPAPFATNTEPRGRAFIFAIDHEQIHPGNEKPAIDAATRLLDRLAPEDRAAVVTMPRGKIEADLSTDREAVRQALAGVIGHAPRKSSRFEFSIKEAYAVLAKEGGTFANRVVDEMVARECEHESQPGCPATVKNEASNFARETENRARDTVRGLQAFLTGLSALDGTKSVIFISEALVQSPDVVRDMQELGKAADLARVRMFVIQINHPSYDVGRRLQPADESGDLELELSGLEDVAGVTGGEMFRPSGRMDAVMSTIDKATSAYYLLGFEPTDKERDGRYHKIQLTLTPQAGMRNDVRLKSRNGFQISTRTETTTTDADASPLAGMLRDNLRTYRDLPMRAAAFAYRSTEPSQVKIVVMTESLGTAPLKSAAFALISESGGQGAEWVADAKELAASPMVTAGAVLPGRYRVRVAAADAIGRHGVVDVLVDAQLADASPLQLSALMAGRLANNEFQPRFDFPGGGDVTGLLEIYNVPLLSGTPSVTLELSATVNSPALVSIEMGIGTTPVADRRLARGTLTIPANAPEGDLILRARVSLDGHPAGTVIRTIRR